MVFPYFFLYAPPVCQLAVLAVTEYSEQLGLGAGHGALPYLLPAFLIAWPLGFGVVTWGLLSALVYRRTGGVQLTIGQVLAVLVGVVDALFVVACVVRFMFLSA